MSRPRTLRHIAWCFVVVLGLAPAGSLGADPQPYEFVLRPSGDKALDAAVRDSSALVALREKGQVGGFALVQRAGADVTRFQDALRAFGYYDGTVEVMIGTRPLTDPALPTEIDAAPEKPPIPVTVTITPGPRFHIGQVEVDGTLPSGHEASIKAALHLARGQDALAAEVLAANDRLLAAVREAGYPMATVTLQPSVLHRETAQLDVAFQVNAGPHANLGQINFSGLRRASEAYMRRRLLLTPGKPFSPSAIEAAQKDLLSTGVFSSARILPGDNLAPDGTLPLRVEVVESPLHAVDVGAAYSTDLGVNLNAAWHHRDLFGQGEQLNLTATVQLGGDATTQPGYQVGAQFIKPDFLTKDQSLNISLNAVKQSLTAYDQTGLIQRVGIERKLSPTWTISAGLLGEEENIGQDEMSRTYNLLGLPVSAKYDTTKSLLDPVNGVRATLSFTPVESFGTPGGAYVLIQASGSAYFDLLKDGRSVIAIRGLVGEAAGAGVFAMPPDQRFYAGGSATVRGYRYQSVGPQFSNGQPTGGNAVSAGSVEFRQRIFDHFGVVGFLDAGQLGTNGNPFGQSWHVGAGVGVRYYTAIGPIRLDLAVPLDRLPGGDSVEVYIGIGQAF